MIERIGQEIAEAEAEKTGCLAEVNQRRDVGSRIEQLTKSGWASQIRTAEAFATKKANVTRCEMANAKIERFKIERNSAQTGVFLRDGTSDVPYSQQQPRQQSKAMRILAVLGLMVTLAGCTGDRLRQSGNEQRQTVVVAI